MKPAPRLVRTKVADATAALLSLVFGCALVLFLAVAFAFSEWRDE